MLRTSLAVITESDCKGCGSCCRHMGHPTFLRFAGVSLPAEEAWVNLPDRLKREIEDHLAAMEAAGIVDDLGTPCIWLGADGSCRHYEHRPEVCREFEVGGEDCLRMRREHGKPVPPVKQKRRSRR